MKASKECKFCFHKESEGHVCRECERTSPENKLNGDLFTPRLPDQPKILEFDDFLKDVIKLRKTKAERVKGVARGIYEKWICNWFDRNTTPLYDKQPWSIVPRDGSIVAAILGLEDFPEMMLVQYARIDEHDEEEVFISVETGKAFDESRAVGWYVLPAGENY